MNPEDHNVQTRSVGICVVARFRPLNEDEKAEPDLAFAVSGNVVHDLQKHSSVDMFDRVYDQDAMQEEVYDGSCSGLLREVIDGYNGAMFAYGQSGGGKTHSMIGEGASTVGHSRGIIPRACTELFELIDEINAQGKACESPEKVEVKVGMFEIYGEKVYDLMTREEKPAAVNGFSDREVEALIRFEVKKASTTLDMFNYGNSRRKVAATRLNKVSSRSHAIFVLKLTRTFADFSKHSSWLYFVDLQGSEPISETPEGDDANRREETGNINLSLLHLGVTVRALAEKTGKDDANDNHLYRSDVLTWIMRKALGGNARTVVLITCSPHSMQYFATINTLGFGMTCKGIQRVITTQRKLGKAELAQLVAKLQGDLSGKSKQISELKSKNSTSQKEHESVMHQVDALVGERNELMATLEALEEALCQKEDEMRAELEGEKLRHTAEQAELQSEMEQIRDSMNKEIFQLRLQLEDSLSPSSVGAQEHVEEVRQLQLEKLRLSQDNSELQAALQAAQSPQKSPRKSIRSSLLDKCFSVPEDSAHGRSPGVVNQSSPTVSIPTRSRSAGRRRTFDGSLSSSDPGDNIWSPRMPRRGWSAIAEETEPRTSEERTSSSPAILLPTTPFKISPAGSPSIDVLDAPYHTPHIKTNERVKPRRSLHAAAREQIEEELNTKHEAERAKADKIAAEEKAALRREILQAEKARAEAERVLQAAEEAREHEAVLRAEAERLAAERLAEAKKARQLAEIQARKEVESAVRNKLEQERERIEEEVRAELAVEQARVAAEALQEAQVLAEQKLHARTEELERQAHERQEAARQRHESQARVSREEIEEELNTKHEAERAKADKIAAEEKAALRREILQAEKARAEAERVLQAAEEAREHEAVLRAEAERLAAERLAEAMDAQLQVASNDTSGASPEAEEHKSPGKPRARLSPSKRAPGTAQNVTAEAPRVGPYSPVKQDLDEESPKERPPPQLPESPIEKDEKCSCVLS